MENVLPEVTIPAEESDDGATTLIYDSEDSPDQRDRLIELMGKADAILVLYADDRPETLDRLGSVWLPLIQEHTQEVPIAIVCNKVDKRLEAGVEQEQHRSAAAAAAVAVAQDAATTLSELCGRFRVQASLDCSCKTQDGLEQAFRFAHMMVLYPVAPLYNIHTGCLKRKFRDALARIFRIFDQDMDGLWSDAELVAFQRTCFDSVLQHNEIQSLKQLVGAGLRDNKVSLEGLCTMMVLFIERSQLITPWRILRTFDYNDDLDLELPEPYTAAARDATVTWQLSISAVVFLEQLFELFAGTAGVLTAAQQTEIFASVDAPSVAPWHPLRNFEFEFDGSGGGGGGAGGSGSWEREGSGGAGGAEEGLSRREWMALWQMVTALNPDLAVRYLFFLGMFGTHGCGCGGSSSSSGSGSSGGYDFHDKALYRARRDKDVTLIVTDVTEADTDRCCAKASSRHGAPQPLSRCDIALLIFDPRDYTSAEFAVGVAGALPDSMPRLFVSTAVVSGDEALQPGGWRLVAKHCQRAPRYASALGNFTIGGYTISGCFVLASLVAGLGAFVGGSWLYRHFGGEFGRSSEAPVGRRGSGGSGSSSSGVKIAALSPALVVAPMMRLGHHCWCQ
ncbi:hypothetical protein JKP88DRAFT_305467 [Tribonema minus]|uniref:EF hand associated type-2 domain-containing protein n=1 Tax=Tribonema minus TaxID=303371 RepID=A0A835Z902_9STRA|nr:hypothetical protein JKP88DRAFT_305467 [Tribonema minus]